MIKGKQAILNYFDQLNEGNQEHIYFSIFKKGTVQTGNPCIETPTEAEGWNFERSRDYLDKWLQLQQYGDFIIIVNSNSKVTSRGSLRQDFSIPLNESTVTGIGSVPGLTQSDIDKAVSGALTQYKQEQELTAIKKENEDLKKENKQLKQDSESVWNKVLGRLEPFAPHILAGLGIIPKPVVNGTGVSDVVADEVKEGDLSIQLRLEKVVQIFSTQRPNDWLELLERMAAKLEKNPAAADALKMFL